MIPGGGGGHGPIFISGGREYLNFKSFELLREIVHVSLLQVVIPCSLSVTSRSRYIISRAHGVKTRYSGRHPSVPPPSCSRVSCESPAPRNLLHNINITRIPRTSPGGPSQSSGEAVKSFPFNLLVSEASIFLRKIVWGDQWSMSFGGSLGDLGESQVPPNWWTLRLWRVPLKISRPHDNSRDSNDELISDGV